MNPNLITSASAAKVICPVAVPLFNSSLESKNNLEILSLFLLYSNISASVSAFCKSSAVSACCSAVGGISPIAIVFIFNDSITSPKLNTVKVILYVPSCSKLQLKLDILP